MALSYPPLTSGSLLAGTHRPTGEQNALVLLEKNGQKVLYKTFTAGETRPTHHAPVEVFVTLRAGSSSGKKKMPTQVTAGDYDIIPNGAPHTLECLEAARILIFR